MFVNNNQTQKNCDDVKFKLHKEEFEVNKKWVDSADVKVYKKKYTVEKQITVPVICEELIIEKKIKNQEISNNGQTETIKIPLFKERIEVILHPTVLEDVDIYMNQFEELKQITETVKEEKIHIETIGNVKVIEEN